MGMVARVGAALQQALGPLAEDAAREAGVVARRRKFTPASLARTFVLGFLQKPAATAEDLARVAAQCGAPVSPQAVDQRQTPRLAAFLEGLFRRAVRLVVGSDGGLAPLLDRFPGVVLLDSTTINLPDGQGDRFPGCGGRCGFGRAAVKLQTELDLRTGALTHVEAEPGRSADSSTSRQHARRPPGTLRVTDLGYFCLGVFAALVAAGEHFLTRLQFGVGVRRPDGTQVDLLGWLAGLPGPLVDRPVLAGDERLACRLIAWRLPPEPANRRRQKLRAEHRRKWGREPTAGRLAWCDWTILVTDLPPDRLTAAEAVALYRARWQIELLFKRWKSQGLVAALTGPTEVRQVIRVWARLAAAVVQHWLVVSTAWGDPTRSWGKAAEAVRTFVGRLLAALDLGPDLERVIADLTRVVRSTCRRNPRKRPGTVELLNDITRLDFGLT